LEGKHSKRERKEKKKERRKIAVHIQQALERYNHVKDQG
jgi:hypothetical protein